MRNENELLDIEKLWKRIGLGELRKQLKSVIQTIEEFEQTVKLLPGCDQCAKVALLEHIEKEGRRLGTQVMSLTALTSTLKGASNAAETLERKFLDTMPHPCQCGETPCTCH